MARLKAARGLCPPTPPTHALMRSCRRLPVVAGTRGCGQPLFGLVVPVAVHFLARQAEQLGTNHQVEAPGVLMRVHGAHAVAHVLAVTAANEYLEQPLAPLGNCPSLQHIDESHLVQPGPFKRGGGEGGRARLLCQQRERGALAGRVEGRGGARQWPAGLARAGRRRAGQGGKRPAGGWCGCVGSAVGSLGNLRGGAPACPREDAALNHVVYAEQQRIVHHPAGAQKASVAPRLTQQLPLGARLQPEFPSGRPVRVLANGGVQLGVPIDPGALEVVTLV
mmetsp:Transcript_5535/g.18345  ORF Transcript_5535/g.18345 Transcript_5535/m.18345 type:complete len:279 (-) Transcript_5535:820-1656(-)